MILFNTYQKSPSRTHPNVFFDISIAQNPTARIVIEVNLKHFFYKKQ
jgi:hypothetical protein